MAHYLVQVSYTPEAWAAMVKNPQDRIAAVAPVVERVGGRIVGGWLAFGDYDIVAICDMPDNVSAAAFSMAASAGGAIKAFKTTPLMSTSEATDAMRKAGGSGYAPPA
jgi:uncharacterized protein with GYD domain